MQRPFSSHDRKKYCCIKVTLSQKPIAYVVDGIKRVSATNRRSQVHLLLEIDHLTRRRWRTTMKKFLLATIGLVALGMAAPASAADLDARPYTRSPAPMGAAIYDWSGFYIGANGGWGSS